MITLFSLLLFGLDLSFEDLTFLHNHVSIEIVSVPAKLDVLNQHTPVLGEDVQSLGESLPSLTLTLQVNLEDVGVLLINQEFIKTFVTHLTHHLLKILVYQIHTVLAKGQVEELLIYYDFREIVDLLIQNFGKSLNC